MEPKLLNVYLLVEVALVGAFMLLYPRIARKGLLFGVYVGEERWRSAEARAITRAWYAGTVVAMVSALTVGVAVGTRPRFPLGALAAMLVMAAAFAGLYLVAYRRAGRLASVSGPPPATAALDAAPELGVALPQAVLAIAAIAGLCVIEYTVARYEAIPDPTPTHFGISGRPDGWSKKSVGAVMVLPIMTLVTGVTLGGVSLLTAHAKRGLRLDDGASLNAQNRFRAAVSRYLAILALLNVTILASISVTAVQVALGQRQALPAAILLVALAMLLFAVIGAAWLALRYGQGGARLETAAGAAPLTDGLADNRLWKLGVFYVNHDDPSWLVEHRFGFGYTLNFGNARAVATFCAFLGAILALTLWAVLSSM